MTDSKFILVIDPGRTTGIASVDASNIGNPVFEWSDELDFIETCNRVNKVLRDHPQTQVVMERFTITPQTGKNGPGALDAIGIIGVVRYLVTAYGAPEIVYQTPAQAKNFCDNTRLRALGVWHRGGAGHARDALRHAVLYLVNQGWRPADLLQH